MARWLSDQELEAWLTEATARVFGVPQGDLIRDADNPQRFAFLFKEAGTVTTRRVPVVVWERLEEPDASGTPRVNALLPRWRATQIRPGLMSFEPNDNYRPPEFARSRRRSQ